MTKIEEVARAIYDKVTRFDGDQIAVHLSMAPAVDGSATNAAELLAIVMSICEDAASAALSAMETPTEEMVDAVRHEMEERGFEPSEDDAAAILKAGITAALADPASKQYHE